MESTKLADIVTSPSASSQDIIEHLPGLAVSSLPREQKATIVNALLRDPRPEVRFAATSAARLMGNAESCEPLLAVFNHEPNKRMRRAALFSLASLLPVERLRSLVLQHIDEEPAEWRADILTAADFLPDADVIDLCRSRFTTDYDPRVRFRAAACLALRGDEEAIRYLQGLVDDTRDFTEAEPVEALCIISKMGCVPGLLLLRALIDRCLHGSSESDILYFMIIHYFDFRSSDREKTFEATRRWVESQLAPSRN